MSRITRFILTFAVIALVGLGELFAATPPSSQARFISFSEVTSTSAKITFVKGNGVGRVIVISDNDLTVDVPSNNTDYVDVGGNYTHGSIQTITSDKVIDVLTGSEWFTTLTNLEAGHTYTIKVYEYNNDGLPNNTAFQSGIGTNNPRSFTTLVSVNPPTALLANNVTATTADLSWTAASPAPDGYIFSLWVDDNNQGGGDGTTFDGTGTVVQPYDELDVSSLTSLDITDLQGPSDYKYTLYSYIGNSNSTVVEKEFFTPDDATEPQVSSITMTGGTGTSGTVYEGDNGNDLTFVVTFNEKMKTWLTPTFTFENPTPLDLSYVTGSWDDDGMVFTATVNFAGTTPQESLLVDVAVSNAEDLAGNPLDFAFDTEADLFNIDNTDGVLSAFDYATAGANIAQATCKSAINLDVIEFEITLAETGFNSGAITGTLNFIVVAEDQDNDNQITFTSADAGNGVYLFTTTLANSQAEGDYNLNIQFTDNAGNVVTDNTHTNLFRIDNTPPSISGVNFANTCVNDADVVTLTFTATDVDGCGTFNDADISVENNTELANDWVFAEQNGDIFTYTLNVPAGNDGTYDVTITATDDAGNESTDETTGAFTIDNTVPTIGNTALSSTCVKDGTLLTLTFDVTDVIDGACGAIGSGDISVSNVAGGGGNLAQAFAFQSVSPSGNVLSFTYTMTVDETNEVDDNFVVNITATDKAGNASATNTSQNFNVDNTKPAFSIVSMNTTCENGGNTVTLTFTATEAGCGTFNQDDIVITDDVTTATNTWTHSGGGPGTGIYTYTLPLVSGDPDGLVTVAINATDDAGNAATEATTTFTIDNTAPVISALTVTSATCLNDGAAKLTFTFNVVEEGCGTFNSADLTVDAGLFAAPTPISQTGLGTAASPYIFTYSNTISNANGDVDGAYNIIVDATDDAGNVATQLNPALAEFNVDNTAPVLSAYTVTGGDGSCLVVGETIEFTVTVAEAGCGTFDSDDITIGITPALTNALVADNGNPVNGSGTYIFSAVIHADDNDGDYQITFNGTDVAGNAATEYAPAGADFAIDNTPPVLSNLVTSSVPGGSPTRVGGTALNRVLTIALSEVTGGCADLVPATFVYTITGPGNVAYTQAIPAPTESPVGTWTTATTVPTNEPSGNYQIVVTAEDENGNEVTLDPSGVEFIIDNAKPYVTGVTASKSLLNLADDTGGATDFSITVQYNEELNQDVVPTLEFHIAGKNPTSPTAAISPTTQTKPTTSSYTYNFSLDNTTNVDMRGIGVRTNGAIDLVGNQQTAAGTKGNLFGIDFVAPQLNSITVNAPSPAVILDDTPQLQLVFDFTETMDNNFNPTVTFETGSAPNNVILGNILGTPAAGTWNLGNVFTATYTVNGSNGLEVDNVGVGIANATDLAGNPFPGSFEAGVFDVDTKEPGCGSITMTPAAPTVIVADKDFEVVVVMDQTLDAGVNPTIAFTNTIGNYTIDSTSGSYGIFTTTNLNDSFKFLVTHDGTQENATPTMSISGFKDTHGNVQTLACTADFDVDTKLPEIVSIAVSESNICGNMEGTEVITITFDEAMDILTVPTLTFVADLTTNILKSPSTLWNIDSTVFTVTYTIDTVGSYTYTGVDISVSGAKDALGNTMDLDNTHGIDKINVDSEGPTVTGIAFNPIPSNAFGVNRSNIGANGFQVVVTYDEAMDGGTAPTIVFQDPQGGTGTSALALSAGTGSWTSTTEYTKQYTVNNALVEVDEVTAIISGAIDACGNTQESFDSFDVEASFAIDLIAPTCQVISAEYSVIYEGYLTQEVYVDFSEEMSTSVTPTIKFTNSSAFTITPNFWLNSNTDYKFTAVHSGAQEEINPETVSLDIVTTTPTDLAGNPILVATCSDDFEIDTKKPLVSSVTFTPEDINGTGTLSVAVAFNENMGATVPTLTFSAGSAAFTPAASSWSGNTYTFNYTVADEDVDVDGVTVTINTAKDLAGNVMAAHTSTETFDIDQVSPTIVGLTVSDAMINKAEAGTIGYTFTAAATFSEAMNTSANPSIAFAPDVTAGSPSLTLQAGTNPAWSVGNTVATWTYTASDQSVAIEGIDITIAGGEDAFGNATDYTTNTGVFADKFSIDTENPTIAFGQTTPLAESCVNGTEEIDFTSSDGIGFSGIDQVQGRINGGSFAACTTGVQLNALNGWPGTDGPITLELKALDLAGNTTTISRDFTADVTAPVIGGESFTSTCVTTGDVINISFTITETGCGAILANNITASGFPVGNGVLSAPTITGNTPYVVTATYTVGSTDAQGVYNITFDVTDDAGNDATPSVSNAAFTIDKTAPSYSVNTPPTPTCTNKNTNVQLVIESDDDTFGCGPYGASNITASTSLGAAAVTSLGGNVYGIVVDLSGTTSQDDGSYDIDIVMTDVAGNVNNQTIEEAFTLDNSAPAISNVEVTPGCIKGGTTATLTFDVAESGCGNFDNTNITVADNVGTNGTWTYSGFNAGTYTYTLLVDGNDPNGAVDVTVSATDAAGNTTTGVDAGDTDFTIDNTAPEIAISQPLANATVNGTKVVNYTVTETGCGIDVTEFRFNSGTWFTAPATGTALSGYTGFAGLGEGAFTLNFRSTDVAGNVGTSSVSLIKDTQAPTVTTVTPSDNLISIADGGSTFTVAVLFSEGMNTTVNPTVALTANGTVANSSSTGVWSGGNTFTATFGTINGASAEEIANLDVTVSGAKDDTEDDGNVMTLQTIVDKFSIDTKAPTCSTMTNNNADIYENDKNVTVTVVFSEAMSASPLPTFNITGTSQLTPGATNWTNASTFTQVFTHTGVEETTSANFVVGNLPKDAAGNPAVSVLCSTDVDIDTRKPLVSGVTFTPSLITEATAAFSVAIEFNEAMGATAPTVSFNGGVSSAFSAPSGGWVGNTYTYNYTVTDQNFSLSGLTVDISGAKDVAGNVMVTKTSVQTYAIDQVAPTISAASIKSSNSINDQYAKGGHDILLTFTSSETLNTGAFTGNIAGYSISSISSLGTTYTLSVSTDNTIAAGLVTFSIGFEDVNGNAGAALLTAVTNGSSVTVDKTPPVGTIALAGGQADPTTDGPINFALTFTENVYGLISGDITVGGTAGATTAVVTGSGATYNVAVSDMTGSGTVEITLATAKVTDIAGNDNTATTNTDNSVQYNASGATDVSAGAGAEPATLSSLVDTQGEAVMAFDFDVKDDGVTPGTDLLATLITDISISQGLGNDIGDWTTILDGAELSDGTNTVTGTVGASTIAFTVLAHGAGQIGNVADDNTKTYTLKVWLSNAPSGSIDNKNLAFKVNRSSFTVDGAGSSFAGGAGTDVESGSGNNAIDVDATKLVFTTTPVNTEINTNTTFVVEATDANGNRDVDNGSALTSFLANQSTITSGNTGSLSSGILTLNAVQFSTAFANDFVTATAAGLADGVSSNFNIKEQEPSAITGLNISPNVNEFYISWTNPSGKNTLILAKKAVSSYSYTNESGMDDETTWTANSNYISSATPSDASAFVIYAGSATSVTMTGLEGGRKLYAVTAYAYAGTINSSTQNFNENGTTISKKTLPKGVDYSEGINKGMRLGIDKITPQPANLNNNVSLQVETIEDMPLTLELYDSKGQLMMTLFEGKEFNAGETPFEFNLTNTVSSGQHFLRLTGNGHVVIAPLMIVK